MEKPINETSNKMAGEVWMVAEEDGLVEVVGVFGVVDAEVVEDGLVTGEVMLLTQDE